MVVLPLAFALLANAPPAPSPAAAAPPPATTNAKKTEPPPPAGGVVFDRVNDKNYADLVLKPHAGKVTLVNFWASYCLPCLEEIPALLTLQKKYARDADIVFVATDAPDSTDITQKVLARRKVPLTRTFIVENENPDPFIKLIDDVWQGEMPYTVVYGRDGKPVKKMTGAQTAESFEAALVAAIASKP